MDITWVHGENENAKSDNKHVVLLYEYQICRIHVDVRRHLQ